MADGVRFPPLTLGQLLQQRAQERGNARFLWVEADDAAGPWYTFAQAADQVAQWAQCLAGCGVTAGDRVGLAADPKTFVWAWLALQQLNAVAVPLNPWAPENDRQRGLDLAEAQWMVAPLGWSAGAAKAASPRVLEVAAGEPWACRRLPSAKGRGWAEQGGGVIVFSSGTTGDPKPIGLPTAALLATAEQVVRVHRLQPDDIGFSPLPLFHINAEVVAVLASLVAGSALVLGERFHRRQFWSIVDRHRVTWINAVPAILNVLAAHRDDPRGPAEAGRIRFIRSASAPLAVATRAAIERRYGIPVIETYGLSEAASQVAANPLPPLPAKPGSVGRPAGLDLRVVDAEGRPLPPETVGEIEIRGPAVIDPNWGPNRWAAAKMRGGWYRTGDLGYLDRDGYLFIQGRVRDLINRGGEKVFPREVEEVLLNHPAVAECAVVGRPHPILGEEPVAFVVPKGAVSRRDLPARLEDWAQRQLSPFKRPAAYWVVDALPQNATGKIQRQHLRAQALVAVGGERG